MFFRISLELAIQMRRIERKITQNWSEFAASDALYDSWYSIHLLIN